MELTQSTHSAVAEKSNIHTPFEVFLNSFKEKIKHLFHKAENIDKMGVHRGIPSNTMDEIMSCNPLSVGIPKQYGGRGALMHENLELLSAASYESLGLSLSLGINSALFLQPLAKYGQESTKAAIFHKFLHQQKMGGLMMTEPDFGSDALSMRTSFRKEQGNYHVQGIKHWAGLTGMADFWLVAARERTFDGLKRDIDFFICDNSIPDQRIVVEEYFENLGLYMIPYGRNRINVHIPFANRLEPHRTGVQMMVDLLHRSRLHFPGMGLGFLQRLLDEAILHTQKRHVGSRSLLHYDQVQHRLAGLQSDFTICSALCAHSSDLAERHQDLVPYALEANSIKCTTADLMQRSSQSLLQLTGAKGYKLDHIAGRSTVDSRPYQIFEGSNDILYTQISEAVIKMMNRLKETNLFNFLKSFHLSAKASIVLRKHLDFTISLQMPQRKMVEFGTLISRIVSMEMLYNLIDKGFRSDLIRNASTMLEQEIAVILSGFGFKNNVKVIEAYLENSSWMHHKK